MPTHYRGTPEEIRALNAFIKFMRAYESMELRLSQGGCQGDLTPSQFGVLETLYHLGTMCQHEIGTKILKSSGNVTLVIDNLEKQGLVKRQRDTEDRRMVMVSLTPKGKELIEAILPHYVASIVKEFSVLTPTEQETFARLCRKLGKQEAA